MKEITKKRLKASFIDGAVYYAGSLVLEHFLKKKIKNEAITAPVASIASQYILEYAQFKTCGQTLGFKLQGLELASENGTPLTSQQLVKRMIERDTKSTWKYVFDKENFEKLDGAVFPHDEASGTIVKQR